jgi:flagellar hook-associated protein 3 FlgL
MRVSERMRYDVVQDRINNTKETNANALERLSTQKDVRKLSDNPIKASDIIRYRDQFRSISQFQKNIEYSKGLLEITESSLERVTNGLVRAKELAVAMSNDSNDAGSRHATSAEIKEIIDEIVQTANSTFNGRYIFSGFRNDTPALSLDGDFLGDDGALFLQISPDDFRQVNMPGRYVFEANQEERNQGHFNMIDSLELLYAGLVHNEKEAIHKAMSELDHQLEKATSSRATVGGLAGSLSAALGRLEGDGLHVRNTLSKTEDADIFDASSDFRRTESMLQATLMSSTKLLQPSLLNFLQ